MPLPPPPLRSPPCAPLITQAVEHLGRPRASPGRTRRRPRGAAEDDDEEFVDPRYAAAQDALALR